MVSTTSRYLVRFAVHLTPSYCENFLAELSVNTGAMTRQLRDGRFEITGYLPKNSGYVLDALEQEQSRGALIIEEFPKTNSC
jgi:hypothetical protein